MKQAKIIMLTMAIAVAGTRAQSPDSINQGVETLLNGSMQDSDRGETMSFVFELVRHGARAPLENRSMELFPVSEGQLTPEGMRQRYLLGRNNRIRYTQDYPFLSEKIIPDEVLMQSTDVNRTIQSGYSELMGLYPPGLSDAEPLTPGMVQNINEDWAVPFKVRDQQQINDQLGFAALPNQFAAQPIFLYLNPDLNDDCSTSGCPYINTDGTYRSNEPLLWARYDDQRKELNVPLQEAIGVTAEDEENADFHTFQTYTDTATSEDFQGIFAEADYFTDNQWLVNNEFQRYWLSNDYSANARNLMMSRALRKPLKVMQQRVAAVLGQSQDEEDDAALKFLIYSAHDTQVDNMRVFLTQNKESFEFVPYASQVTFELKYSSTCVSDTPSNDCFGVTILSNGDPMTLESCTGDGFSTDGSGCTYDEFTSYISSIWYSGEDADDLNAACGQTYVPTPIDTNP